MEHKDLFSAIVNRRNDNNSLSLVSIDEYKLLSKIATDDGQRDVCWDARGYLSVRGIRVVPDVASDRPLPDLGTEGCEMNDNKNEVERFVFMSNGYAIESSDPLPTWTLGFNSTYRWNKFQVNVKHLDLYLKWISDCIKLTEEEPTLPELGDDPKGFIGLVNPSIGKKNDQGKTRMDLIPFGSLEEIAKVLTFGAKEYGPDNWKRVEDSVARYEAALLRHITAYKKGEMNDPDSGLPHLAHAGCCLMFLMEFTTGSLKPY